ncbi:MAG TPA: relaxase/mobilization nuclease domain-containing protein [Clostridia bacterium]|nr:relaxase/mobilization nuclease domain-containing protein [Clostridia bacterium]
MAVFCKVHSIKERLDKRINYAITADKTKTLVDKIEYATDVNKTEQAMFSSAINCDSVDTAYSEMDEVKRRYRKTDGVIGYTFIQSFSPEEKLTPEQAHGIGIRLAEEFFGERFQVVVGTHLDKAHLHNHFVINSVSFIDGKKYLNKLHYLDELRAINDRLCAEYGLSVIVPYTKAGTENYSDWKDRKSGVTPRNDIMRNDIDACIQRSLTFSDFVSQMSRLGYSIRYGPNIKYMTICAPGAERSRRVYKLGYEYTEEAMRRRISDNTPEQVAQAIRNTLAVNDKHQGSPLPRVTRVKWNGRRRSQKKLKGLQARYYRILYTLGMIRNQPRTNTNRSMYFTLYDQIRQFDSYVRQMKLLSTCNVKNMEELSMLRESSSGELTALITERRTLYRHPDNAVGGLKTEIDRLSARITELRRIVRDCDAIKARSAETVQRIRVVDQQNNLHKHKNAGVRER